MYFVFHCDQWPIWKQKQAAISLPFIFLLWQRIMSDHPLAAPISLIFLNKVGSVITEVLLEVEGGICTIFYKLFDPIPRKWNTWGQIHARRDRQLPPAQTHGAQTSPLPLRLMPKDHMPVILVNTRWNTSTLYIIFKTSARNRENYNRGIKGGGLLWAQVELPYSYNVLTVSLTTRTVYFHPFCLSFRVEILIWAFSSTV